MRQGQLSLKKRIQTLLRQQRFAVLATYSGQYPYTSVVGFAATKDLGQLFFATPRNTEKYKNIRLYPKVSMLIGSHRNLAVDFKGAQALTVQGQTRSCPARDLGRFRKGLTRKHPQLRAFLSDPETAMIILRVKNYVLVSQFQKVEILRMP